ncbi:MAG TPA: 4-alpha-glucanotransferase [Kofleriaceae bacterium]|nr:4-alpha-glucanotransferase [Kofleriaceae bacterium]
MTALGELAKAAGLDPEYLGWDKRPVASSETSLIAALRALAPDLGIVFEHPGDAPAAIAAIEQARWAQRVPPVVIGWDGELVVPFSVPADRDAAWQVTVTTEAGQTVEAHGTLFMLPAEGHAWPGGKVQCVRRARIAVGELGYHTVHWRLTGALAIGGTADHQGEAFAIAAPRLAWGGPGTGARRWGVFAPVYGLAGAASGQAGDLASLRRLFADVERRGGSYVATLPILAASLDELCQISPYSPASRLYWNELYLDLGALAAELGVPPPAVPPVVAGTLIDYQTQYRWRRHALDPMAERLFATRGAEIDAWAAGSGAYDYAAFRALREVTRQSWRDWPAQWRDGAPVIASRADAIALGADAARLTSHTAAQWVMQRQLTELAAGKVQLYLDLPVGVSCDAYEVWRHRGLFLTELSAGAPPDALFLGGQSWGLPPLSPIALRRDHYRYFIRCVRHHMQVAGMLRIDHVMGLFRLYCVPDGRPATDGVYLRYPHDELLAVLTLESNRSRCALVGEDLGTVPDGVRPAMAEHGLFRLHVGQWFLPARPGEAPQPSPPESVASLNTHDTATFAGWWRGTDIDDRRDLGLITEAQELEERVERDASRTALLAFAQPAPAAAPPAAATPAAVTPAARPAPAAMPAGPARPAGDALTDVERAMVAVTADLAAGPAEVMLVALDDLVLDPVPHNVPGTVHERPNWQRRVEGWSDALDADRASPAAAAAIAAVVAARPAAK